MAIWLLKTEPTNYSYDDLERDHETVWDGVTNNAALKNIRAIQTGDLALIYHTGDERAIVGVADVVRGSYSDPESDDVKLVVCDVRSSTRLKPISLAQIKAHPQLQDWELVRQSRLSVVPVSEQQWKIARAISESS